MIKMPTSCSAYGCTNNSYKLECLERNVSFHKFPLNDEKMLRIWLTKMRRKDFLPTMTTKICSDHFESKYFEYKTNTNRRYLKSNAVPTLFCYTRTVSSPPGSKRKSYDYLDDENSIDDADLDDNRREGTSNKACQTDRSFGNLIDELALKNTEIQELRLRINKFFVPEEMTDSELRALSGLNLSNFYKFYYFLNLKQHLREETLTVMKQFLIFLIKVKTGIPVEMLAYMFQVSPSTISRAFNRVKKLVHIKLQNDSAVDELGKTFCANYISMSACPSETVDDPPLSIMVPGFADGQCHETSEREFCTEPVEALPNEKSQKKDKRDDSVELVGTTVDYLESSRIDDITQDKCDLFSKYVATELRSIHCESLFKETKEAIQGILNDAHVRVEMQNKENIFL